MALSHPYVHGFEDYNSTDGAQSIAQNAHTTLVNNGLGAFTNTNFKVPGRGDMWNVATNRLDFQAAGLQLGDTVEIRTDMSITTAGGNREIQYGLTLAEGASSYDLTIGHDLFKSAGTYQKVTWVSIYMGDLNTLENPALFWIESDSPGDTVVYNGHMLKSSLRRAVYA